MSEQVLVEMDRGGTPVPVGTAYFHVARSQVSTTFKYSDDYLGARWAYSIDPALPLSSAPYSVPGLPGSFADCAPDRWGRNLVTKHYQRLVAEGAVRHRRLTEVDYLLGVSDTTRQGALRFRDSATGEYLGTGSQIPRLISLPELQHAADEVAEGSEAAIKRLLDAGTGSLGGARPKASVAADGERLMIAKFSRPTDEWSVIAWERLALELAEDAGLQTPASRLLRIENRPVLVLERFDRPGGSRLGYISAMTATGRHDGEPGDYIDIVEAIEDSSGQWRRDCAELFRRAVYSVAIHNTDDHLRNHGFLRSESGWQLSPAFDLNPEPDALVERQTAICGITDSEHEAEALLQLAPLCHLSAAAAHQIVLAVVEAVAGWRYRAQLLGIPGAESRSVGGVIDEQLSRLRALAERGIPDY